MKRILVFVITCMTGAMLLLSSCGQGGGTPTQTTTPPPTTQAPTKTTATTAPAAQAPKPGGTLRINSSLDIAGFDHAIYPQGFLNNVFLVNDTTVLGDWSRGLAGTGEIDWALNSQKRIDYTLGLVAESFTLPAPGTIVFKIRQGVHWSMDSTKDASKLVNGREMTASDVAFSLTRHIQSPLSYVRVTQPTAPATTTATVTGPWEVTLKTSIYDLDAVWLIVGEREIWPKELIDKYTSVTDWRNQVGNGPFMMTDFVSNSSAVFVKNPTYWGKDPVGAGKGNRLPYVDRIEMYIIADVSTQQSAFRTGKIDVLSLLNHDDFVTLQKSTPALQYHSYISGAQMISMRQDKPNLPFSNIKVRQALMMGTDFNSLIKQFYAGEGDVLGWPIINTPGYAKAYMPLDEMPAEVKQLFTYNPDQAKQLLKDAGWPNGFKATLLTSSQASAVDFCSAIKEQWSKIGVDVTLDLKETVAYFTIMMSRQYDSMAFGFYVQPGPYAQLLPFRGDNTFNRSWVKDDKVESTYQEIVKSNLVDQAKVDQLHRALMPYVLGQAWYIPQPVPKVNNVWQSWLKNYHGENLIGYQPAWVRYVWIDQDLKAQLGK